MQLLLVAELSGHGRGRFACGKLGNSSVRYEVGLFRNDDDVAAAQGHFVHVYVDRQTRRPVALPPALRQALQALVVDRPER